MGDALGAGGGGHAAGRGRRAPGAGRRLLAEAPGRAAGRGSPIGTAFGCPGSSGLMALVVDWFVTNTSRFANRVPSFRPGRLPGNLEASSAQISGTAGPCAQ